MTLRHERRLAAALDRKARIRLSLGKEFATGNRAVPATNHDHDAQLVDIDKTLAMDIQSGDVKPAEV